MNNRDDVFMYADVDTNTYVHISTAIHTSPLIETFKIMLTGIERLIGDLEYVLKNFAVKYSFVFPSTVHRVVTQDPVSVDSIRALHGRRSMSIVYPPPMCRIAASDHRDEESEEKEKDAGYTVLFGQIRVREDDSKPDVVDFHVHTDELFAIRVPNIKTTDITEIARIMETVLQQCVLRYTTQ